MEEFEELALTIDNEGDTYAKRMALAKNAIETGSRDLAEQSMVRLLSTYVLSNTRLFGPVFRTKAVLEAAAKAALDTCIDHHNDVHPELQARTQSSSSHPTPGQAQATSSPDAGEFISLPSRKVAADVLSVLRQCRQEGDKVYLPTIKLDRALYADVNDVLAGMGGKWKSGKTQAHVFADVDQESFGLCFAELQASGSYTHPKDLEFFRTSEEMAAQVVQISGLRPGMTFGELSAGDGAIARQAAAIVGHANVRCIEIFPPNVRALEKQGFTVEHRDFLSVEPPADEADKLDVIGINPPFSAGKDVAHFNHALKFLKRTGRIVSITSPSWEMTGAKNRKSEAFRNLLEESQAEVIKVDAGAFKAEGTMVATRIITLDAKNLPWNRAPHMADDQEETEEFAAAPAP